MKKRLMGVISSVPVLSTLAMRAVSAASCPYGVVYCPYPGQCPHYIDINGNGQCDLSLSQISDQASDASGSGDQQASSGSDGQQSIDTSPADTNDPNATANGTDLGGDRGLTGTDNINYHFLPITISILSLYFFTHFLFERGILSQKKHRKLWNSLLFVGYIGTGITGVLLAFMVNLGISLIYRQGITYWHVELAILMVMVTFNPLPHLQKVI